MTLEESNISDHDLTLSESVSYNIERHRESQIQFINAITTAVCIIPPIYLIQNIIEVIGTLKSDSV